jgi:nucleotide-binding universal stress UspA family protein
MKTERQTAGRPHQPRMIFQRILVATDGSPAARAADATAIQVARACGGCVRFVSVIDTDRLVSDFSMGTDGDFGDVVERLKTVARAVLEQARGRASEAGVDAKTAFLEGDVVDRILEDAAAWRADVIMIGTHARPHELHPSLGSKAHELLRRSTLPVLVCR